MKNPDLGSDQDFPLNEKTLKKVGGVLITLIYNY